MHIASRMKPRPHTTVLAATLLALVACARLSEVERAQSLVRQHRDSEARALLEAHLREHPGDTSARRLLVRVLGATGDVAAAQLAVEQLAAQMRPGDPTPYLELGHAFELAHRYDDALAAYDEASQQAPASPAGPREGGMRSARWGELDQAAPRLEEAIRRGATDPETWHALGLVRFHLGDLDGAEQAYRRGAAAGPDGAACWLGLATLAVARDEPQQALIAYDRVLSYAPRFGAAELGRAWALLKLKRKAEAERALTRAQQLGEPPSSVARLRAMLAESPSSEQ
jgi:superkiller protein 3